MSRSVAERAVRSQPISIIVPARDAAETLGACLDALAEQRGLDAPPEVLVVDDGSRDETADIAGAHRLAPRLLRQPPRGAAAARNRGAAAAHGRLLLFTDADCRPRPDWAREMIRPFERDAELAGVKGFFESDQTALVARLTQAEYEAKEARMAARGAVPFADTAAAGYRAEVFRSAGGFRADLPAVEDTELAFRLAAAGRRIVVAPAARVLHRHPETWPAYLRRKWRYGRWGAEAYLAHPGRVADDSRTSAAMRLQLLLLPPGLAAALLAPVSTLALPALGLVALLFAISCLPFALRARAKGLDAALAAPLLCLLRALALDAGLARGLAARLATGRRAPQPLPAIPGPPPEDPLGPAG